MSRFYDLVSQRVRDLGQYTPGESSRSRPVTTQPRHVRLDSNENPFGPSPRAVDAIRFAVSSIHNYPDDTCTELRLKLAAHHGVAAEQILVSVGSTGMLSLLCQTFLGPGLNAVTSERSFIVYSMAVHSTGAQLVETPMRNDAFDLDAIYNAINEHTRIIFLANPNNPTATLIPAADIESFLGVVPGHVIVVLDEAYYEFGLHFAALRNVDYPNSLQHLGRGASVVILRTFSKVHGLAGLRIGYGVGPAEVLAYCARMQSTFSVSSISQSAALAALDDQVHIGHTVANNATQAQVIGVGLSELDFRVIPTWANFFCCDIGQDAAAFAHALRNEGVSVRPLAAWGAPTCIRVTIGTPEQNQVLLGAARKIVATSTGGLR
jgi:histidinol-phosphate aminotransferase